MTQVSASLVGMPEYIIRLVKERLSDVNLESKWNALDTLQDPITQETELVDLSFPRGGYLVKTLPVFDGRNRFPALSVFITGYREHEDQQGVHPDIYEYDLSVQIADKTLMSIEGLDPRDSLHQRVLRHAEAVRTTVLEDPTFGSRFSILRLEEVALSDVIESVQDSLIQFVTLDFTVITGHGA